MKLERTKNASKGIIYGTISKVYSIIVPFVMRTAMIYLLGVEYLGLNSLFTSVLHVLNLAELGVGSAMVFSMYQPIAENDDKKICALMNLYKKYYRIIGLVVLCVGLLITPIVPHLIKNGVPSDMNVYILYLLNLMATVFSYWLFAYKNCLLQAHQRNDVLSRITIAVNTLQYLIQFLVLYFFRNYYLYVIVLLGSQIFTNLVTAYVVHKMYPSYKAEGKMEEKEIVAINHRVKDLFTSKVGGVIVGSADSIVISAFLGLTVLAIYQNYYFVVKALLTIVGVFFTSCTAGIGNSLIMESKEKNYTDFNKITFMVSWIAGVCACMLLCLFQNFMIIWVGKDLLVSLSCVICFVLYYYVSELNSILLLYKDAGGIWHKDRFRPLATSLTNLFLNLILVNFIGLYGVLLSTVISVLLVGFPWLIHNLFYELFGVRPRGYLLKLLKYVLTTIALTIVSFFLCSMIKSNTILSLFVRGGICFLVMNLGFYLLYRKMEETKQAKSMIKKVMKVLR